MAGVAFILLIVSLASARVAVLIAHDAILERPREWWYLKFPPYDNPALGYDYQHRDPKTAVLLPMGAVRKPYLFSELLTCTRCLTVWTSIPIYAAATMTYSGLMITELLACMAIASWAAKKL